MKISFDPKLPIYTQIVDGIKRMICSGELAPGDRIATVRELSLELGVNPNTLQRAMSDLEREELIYTERTSGRFVTKDIELIRKVRNELKNKAIEEFVVEMRELGCSYKEVISDLYQKLKEALGGE